MGTVTWGRAGLLAGGLAGACALGALVGVVLLVARGELLADVGDWVAELAA